MEPPVHPVYAFGPFALDPAERWLCRDGRTVALYPKTFDVLTLLVQQAGHLVTKDALLAAAWPGVVVEEGALSTVVSRLRSALGPEGRAYIETVPGFGYRFVAPVAATEAAAPPEPFPLGGDSLRLDDGLGADGPSVEDVVPALTAPRGDGGERLDLVPPTPPVPEAAPAATPPAPSRWRPAWALGLLAGAGALILLAALALRGSAPAGAPARPVASARQPPAEALLAYRRGRALLDSRRGDAMTDALYEFRRATALDSSFAAAYVGEAKVYAFGYRTGPAAEATLRHALALDSTLAEAWATLGFIRAFQLWDWAGAEAAFARARALDPDDLTALRWLASLRMAQRRLPEAEALLRRALTLTPDDAALHADLCEALYYGHAYADALAACDRALALDPGHPFAEEHRQQIQIIGAGGQTVAMRRLANQRAHPIPFDGFLRARLFARLGQRDSALAYVERAVAERAFMAPFLNPNPLFDPYRDDPRWIAAVRRMGLE